MDISAKARYIRMSPRKIRLIVDLVRGLRVDEADAQLTFFTKAATVPVRKLLLSAVANAEHNHKLRRENLWVKAIMVDGGPTVTRFRPRAFGRAAPLRKRTSHISIVLSDDPKAVPEKTKKAVALKAAAPKRTSVAPAASAKA